MRAATPQRRPRVVILGGGFGGVGAAQKLRAVDVDSREVPNLFSMFRPKLQDYAKKALLQ